MGVVSTVYLSVYNAVLSCIWTTIFVRVLVSMVVDPLSMLLLTVAQVLAVLEPVHALLGITRTSLAMAVLQVLGRNTCLFCAAVPLWNHLPALHSLTATHIDSLLRIGSGGEYKEHATAWAAWFVQESLDCGFTAAVSARSFVPAADAVSASVVAFLQSRVAPLVSLVFANAGSSSAKAVPADWMLGDFALGSGVLTVLVLTWSLIECVRFPLYLANTLLGASSAVVRLLTFFRTMLPVILYPIGFASEIAAMLLFHVAFAGRSAVTSLVGVYLALAVIGFLMIYSHALLASAKYLSGSRSPRNHAGVSARKPTGKKPKKE
eukprot:ANDGO_01860.mRNA.1 hypothetical protein